MTHNRRAAMRAAYTAADELIEYDVDVQQLARVIRDELRRQEREFLDRLNAEANRPHRTEPEQELKL